MRAKAVAAKAKPAAGSSRFSAGFRAGAAAAQGL